MKRSFLSKMVSGTILLAMIFGGGSVGLPFLKTSGQVMAAASEISYSTNFEQDTVGKAPAGWTGSCKVQQENETNKYASCPAVSGYYKFGAATGIVTVEQDFKLESTSSWMRVPAIRNGSTDIMKVVYVNGSIRAYNGNTVTVLKSVSQNTWHHIKVEADLTADTYDVYLDGALAAEHYAFIASADTVDNVMYSVSVDNVSISSTPPAPPAQLTQKFDQQETEVNGLPEDTSQQKLKKTALQWSIGYIQDKINNGSFLDADQLLNELADATSADIGNPHEAPANLFPPIPSYDTNPFVSGMFDDVVKLLGQTDFSNADIFKSTIWVMEAAQALMHPQSAMKGNPEVLAVLLNLLEDKFKSLTPGAALLGDFTNDYYPGAYLMLRTVYPDLLLPSIQKEWQADIDRNAQTVMSKYGDIYNQQLSDRNWWNNDIRQALVLQTSGMVLNNPIYLQTAANAIQMLSKTVYPDGGISYRGLEDEAFTYHSEDILATAWYWLLTGSETARTILEETKHYYPLTYDPRGVAEYMSSPTTKHYWNENTPATNSAAYIVASLTGDPYNYAVSAPAGNKLIAAFLYRSDLKAKAFPDDYTLYDRNNLGPRGHYGNYSFVGVTRDASSDPNSLGLGKQSFVGAMVLDDGNTNNGWPLNAALDQAASEVQTIPGTTFGADRANDRFLSQDERDAVTMGRTFSGLTTTYTLSNKTSPGNPFTPLDWQGSQQWLLLPDRMVGMLELTSTADQTAYGIDGTLKLLSGRDSWGTRQTFTPIDDHTFAYGNLRVRIHEQDYGGAITTGYEQASTIDLGDTSQKGARILINDSRNTDDGKTPISYKAGETHYFMVEVMPSSSDWANGISKLNPGSGLTGMQVIEANRILQLIYNPTDEPIAYTGAMASPYRTVSVHSSGSNDSQSAKVQNGIASVSAVVPANGHIIVVSSDQPDDHKGGALYYEDIFEDQTPPVQRQKFRPPHRMVRTVGM